MVEPTLFEKSVAFGAPIVIGLFVACMASLTVSPEEKALLWPKADRPQTKPTKIATPSKGR